ncbi:MAG: DNA repair protein RecN, partial [Longimicrobiales bacterium]|nr:DNA repair protein RecN [Longimicrobiales bacterium]
MLIELRIRNFAVADDVTLTLGAGLNVLSGETGAGKSILIDALALLLGERASSADVRTGTDRASVEAVFDVTGSPDLVERLEELGLASEEGLLLLRREVQVEGRNRAWVNGSPSTATVVGEIGTRLVDLHGQHEHQTLLSRAAQRTLLDAFAGADEVAARVRDAWSRLREARATLTSHGERVRELESRGDFLRFQLSEIDAAGIEVGEEASLREESTRLEHARELAETAGSAHDLLYGGEDTVSDHLAQIRTELRSAARIDRTLDEIASLVDEAYLAAVEAGRAAARYADGIEIDPSRLAELQRRLDTLFRLKRKYGPELEDVLDTAARLRSEVEALDDAEADAGALEAEVTRAAEALEEEAAQLGAMRREAAHRLREGVERLLPELGMPGALFEVRLDPLDEIEAGGGERIDFLVSLNPGFPRRPLARVASGGELSRVMLALKSVLAEVDDVPTLVFDEIDAGIGGEVATAVARRLEALGRARQVFVITHLPQLASRAGEHLLVWKGEADGVAATRVERLEGEARVREIA